jgi:hypothetical protein
MMGVRCRRMRSTVLIMTVVFLPAQNERMIGIYGQAIVRQGTDFCTSSTVRAWAAYRHHWFT